MEWNLAELHRSRRDAWLAGICGGLGECTPAPAWLWRALFVAATVGIGVGLVLYVALWVFMPRQRPPSLPLAPATPAEEPR